MLKRFSLRKRQRLGVVEEADFKLDRRANQSRRSTDKAADELKALYSSLKHISDGIILLNQDGSVYFATDQAKNILATITHLVRMEDELIFMRHKEKFIFADFLLKVSQNISNTTDTSEQCIIALDRDFDQPPVVFCCFLFNGAEKRILIVIHDPQHTVPQWAAFAQYYQLTQAELRLCLGLAEGYNLTEYSKKHYVSVHTARSQLKSVFSKTQTRRQSDLLRLIFSFTRH